MKLWPIACALALAACADCHGPSLPIIMPPLVAADAGATADQCTTACSNIDMAWPDGGCIPKGTCLAACENDQAQGVAAQLDVSCVLEAGVDRARLAACRVGCQ